MRTPMLIAALGAILFALGGCESGDPVGLREPGLLGQVDWAAGPGIGSSCWRFEGRAAIYSADGVFIKTTHTFDGTLRAGDPVTLGVEYSGSPGVGTYPFVKVIPVYGPAVPFPRTGLYWTRSVDLHHVFPDGVEFTAQGQLEAAPLVRFHGTWQLSDPDLTGTFDCRGTVDPDADFLLGEQ